MKPIRPLSLAVLLALTAACPIVEARERPVEGDLAPFLGEPRMTMQQVFTGGRFPNVVVATEGTVLAFWNGVKVRRSEDGGTTWGEAILVGKGFMGGGVTVDETTGHILAFVEAHHPPAPLIVYRSTDHGKTWAPQKDTVIKPDTNGNVPSMHMNEHGITLRHGKHKGRLLRPARWYAGKNARDRWPKHYTNAIYSDDGGKSWHTSDPFPAFGTGEATVAELSDGRIYYNSRRHWAPEGQNPRRRWTAWSDDGGQTWKGLAICQVLPDGDQVRDYGLMAGLVRLPVRERDILVFSNIESQKGRHHGTVWASFNGAKTWPVKRLVYEGTFAYSSLAAGRPGTPSEGWIYLLFEGGPKGGATLARFNLSWLLAGETTGGQAPEPAVPGSAETHVRTERDDPMCTMRRRRFLRQAVGLCAATWALPRLGAAGEKGPGKPNIILILADEYPERAKPPARAKTFTRMWRGRGTNSACRSHPPTSSAAREITSSCGRSRWTSWAGVRGYATCRSTSSAARTPTSSCPTASWTTTGGTARSGSTDAASWVDRGSRRAAKRGSGAAPGPPSPRAGAWRVPSGPGRWSRRATPSSSAVRRTS